MTSTKVSAMTGLGLVVLYCCLATGADAITRIVSQSFEAPQLFFFSGLIVAGLSALVNVANSNQVRFRSHAPWLLSLRSLLFIAACLFYFFAFRLLPFAEVFVFIALVPIFSALLSGPILSEKVNLQSWLALLAGFGGMLLLYPSGLEELGFGHLAALLGAMSGAFAMVLARLVSRYDDNALLQVFYPNVALFTVMGIALPFVYAPMGLKDAALVFSYGVLLFFARWVLVLALSKLKAYVVTLLINLQFVVMVIAGFLLFKEVPAPNLYFGAAIIILAGAYLLRDAFSAAPPKRRSASSRRTYSKLAAQGHMVGARPLPLTLKN